MIVGQFLSFGLGGADKAAYYLTKGLIENGIEVKIFYNDMSIPRSSPQFDYGDLLCRLDQCKSLGVPIIKITKPNELNNHRLNVLNTHRSGDDKWLIPGFERVLFNFKVVETNFHGQTNTKANIRVFPSHEMLANKHIVCNFRVIPNPIMPRLSSENLKASLGIEGKFIFGRIGRPSRDIYSPTSLEAFRMIETDAMRFVYVAPHLVAIEAAKSMGIKNIIFVDPTIDDVRVSKIYNTFDVLCHSNAMGETFGNTIAEAMIHGKPVISHWGSDWPQAQKEVMGESKLGYICDNNAKMYSELMLRLMNNKQEYSEYSVYAKRRAEELYDYRVVAKKYIDLYKGLI